MARHDARIDKREGESHIGRVIGLPAWVKYCMPCALASVASEKKKGTRTLWIEKQWSCGLRFGRCGCEAKW